MADQKLRELTETTTPVSTDLAYLVVDPDGTPLDRKVEVGTLLGTDGAWVNLVKNSPGQIVTDGAEPQWWDDSASATITDEDAAGEAIPDCTERVFKVVTTGNDEYGYQTFTFADESLLDAGHTIVSFSCLVYCATASKASIGIYGTNLGLEESGQHPGDSAWHLLTVENITLHAADASIQLRLIVDTGTAYFTKPMLNPGSKALPWMERQQRFVARDGSTALLDLNTTGDVAWSDLDCTADTHPLATMVQAFVKTSEPNGTDGSAGILGHSDDIVGADADQLVVRVQIITATDWNETGFVMCDDGQNIRYRVAEQDADNDVRFRVYITGYWRWAP